jgi:hypothetical protein
MTQEDMETHILKLAFDSGTLIQKQNLTQLEQQNLDASTQVMHSMLKVCKGSLGKGQN